MNQAAFQHMREEPHRESAIAEHAWTKDYPVINPEVLRIANRAMELVLEESLSIRMSPEDTRFNQDSEYELPDCWIATYSKLA